jgi:hypothetical protein
LIGRLAELILGMERRGDGYSRALQAARVRASYQRAYFAPALFALVPVKTDMIASMAVDARWRLYYNDAWLAAHTVEENAAVLIHEVSHLLRDHEARKQAAAVRDHTLWNTAADCEINDDLLAEGLPLPHDPPRPEQYGLKNGEHAETYYRQLMTPGAAEQARPARSAGPRPTHDCGSGAHGQRRPWELPDDDGSPGGMPGVDSVKAELVRRDVAQRILERVGDAGDVPVGWRRWARSVLQPKVDYLATIRHVHAVLRSAAAETGVPDRHLELDGGHPARASRRRARRADATTRLRHGDRRRVLRCRRPRCQTGLQRGPGGTLRWRRHGRRRWITLVRREESTRNRCAGRCHRL